MLHLAQVQKNPNSGSLQLQTLAYQVDESVWKVENSNIIPLVESNTFNEGTLVLLEREADDTIVSIQPAKDWILSLLQKHLTENAVNPQLVAKEQSKVEKWRQEITIQNLELNRRFLEIETRREQLQELEQTLKQDREQLQELADSLQHKQSDEVAPQS